MSIKIKNINFFNMLHFESHRPHTKMFVYSVFKKESSSAHLSVLLRRERFFSALWSLWIQPHNTSLQIYIKYSKSIQKCPKVKCINLIMIYPLSLAPYWDVLFLATNCWAEVIWLQGARFLFRMKTLIFVETFFCLFEEETTVRKRKQSSIKKTLLHPILIWLDILKCIYSATKQME